MAFNTQKFVRVSAGQFDNSQVAANFNYNGNAAGDTKATILASDYFLDQYANLSKGSMISFTATDATLVLAMVTQSLSTGVTIEEITATLPPSSVDTADIKDSAVTSAKLAADSVTTAALKDGQITAVKMAPGVLPTPIHNSITNTAGGGTQEDIAIPGVLATDVCQVTVHTHGSTGTLTESRTEEGKVKVVFTADPTSSTKLNISVFRP